MGFSHRMAFGCRAAAATVQGAWPVCHVQTDTTSRLLRVQHGPRILIVRVWIAKRASISRMAFSSGSAKAATSIAPAADVSGDMVLGHVPAADDADFQFFAHSSFPLLMPRLRVANGAIP